MLGRDPWTARDQLMRDVCFIADVAVLPRWIGSRSCSIMSPACIRDSIARKPRASWPGRRSSTRSKVRELSKGMVTQLHLALVMAIDARLLVLDEPTLGLDILYRKQFYDSLLNDYFDHNRTIVVTTHQVEEIQHVLTDVMFINRGRIVFESQHGGDRVALSRSDGASGPARRRAGAQADPRAPGARPQHPAVRSDLNAPIAQQLAALGDVRTPSIADLFVAVIGGQSGEAQGAAQ